jgi:hypothetical protein
VKLGINPEIVRVELQPVALGRSGFLRDIQGQCGDHTGAGEPPVAIALGFGIEADHRKFNAGCYRRLTATSTKRCKIVHLEAHESATDRDGFDPLDVFRFRC